jgi:hypothetical protein
MFKISGAKSGKLKSEKAPSLLVKQRQSWNIRLTVGQYVVPENFLTPKMVH